jgi:N6-adenosine-specific RNA methylase IME4
MKLIRYDAACRALDAARRVDEVKHIRDMAVAAQVYATQAKDKRLLDHATQIRKRAERRAGQLLRQMEKNKGAAGGGKKSAPRGRLTQPRDTTPKLADLGISKGESARWQKIAGLDEKTFEQQTEAAVAKAWSAMDGTSTEEKRERRAEREIALASKIMLLPEKKYGVILADPEWRFEPWSRLTGLDRAADNHYPTSCTEVIAARDVPSIAADDCVLFLCATAPMLMHAALVMAVWGFDYKTNFELHKDRIITGYWNRNRHEHLLLGVRGNVPCPAPGEQWDSVIEMKVGRHSAKPEDAICEMIEAYFPNLPKIELNRRGPARPGWDAWGDEVVEAEAAE